MKEKHHFRTIDSPKITGKPVGQLTAFHFFRQSPTAKKKIGQTLVFQRLVRFSTRIQFCLAADPRNQFSPDSVPIHLPHGRLGGLAPCFRSCGNSTAPPRQCPQWAAAPALRANRPARHRSRSESGLSFPKCKAPFLYFDC